MTEIIQISLIPIILFFLFMFPFNIKTIGFIFNSYKCSIFDVLSINIAIQLWFYLFISFFYFNLAYVFVLMLMLGIVNFTLVYKNFLSKIFKNNQVIVLTFFALLMLMLFFDIASNHKLEWDGEAFWIYKAINFYQDKSFVELKNSPTNLYPHLGAFLWGFFWKNSFLSYEYLGRLVFPFFFLVSIFSVADCYKSNNFKKIIFIILLTYLTYDLYLFSGYQEYLIFAILLIFSKYFFIHINFNERSNYLILLFIFLSNILIWFKHEGLHYGVFLAIIIFLIAKIDIKMKIVVLVACALSAIIQNNIFSTFMGGINYDSSFYGGLFKSIANLNLYEVFSRTIKIILHYGIAMLKYPISIASIFLIFVSLIYEKYRKENSYIIVFFVMNLVFLYSIYIFAKTPIDWTLATSMDRLFLETMGFYIPIIIYFINKKFKKF